MRTLDEKHRDAVGEMFNMGIGQAAASLAEMVGHEIVMSVPDIELLSSGDSIAEFDFSAGEQISGVRQEFDGAFWGSALLIFPAEHGLNLVRTLLMDNVPLSELTMMEEETLAEVGNVILNSCLGTFGNLFGEEISTGLPETVRGPCIEVLQNDGIDPGEICHSLLAKVDFAVADVDVDIKGHVLLSIDVHSFDTMLGKVEACFATP